MQNSYGRRTTMIEDADIFVERDGAWVCIRWGQYRLRFEPREARNIAADLDRVATEIAREILE